MFKSTFVTRLFGGVAGMIMAVMPLMAHDPHDPFSAVAVSPNFAQDHTVLAASTVISVKITLSILLESTDGGITWSVAPGLPNNYPISSIAFSPDYAQDQTIYLAGKGGLIESVNQGASWSVLMNSAVSSVTLSPNFATDNTLFTVTAAGTLLTSTDRGHTLTTVAAPSPLTSTLAVVAVSPNYAADHTLLLGGAADGIFESTNGGASWVNVSAGMTLSAITSLAFSPNFASDQTACATSAGTGILLSSNGGTSWTQVNAGIPDLNVTALALSPNYLQDSTIWITSSSGGVFQSNSLGASWTAASTVPRALSNLSLTHYQAIGLGNGPSGIVVFLGMYEGLWSSTDAGATWQYIDSQPTRLIRYINLSPNFTHDHVIFFSTYGSGNVWSTDGGVTWAYRNNGMLSAYTDASGISPNYTNDGIAFSSNDEGLQRTSNHGKTWQLMQGMGTACYPRALAISPGFAQDSTVLIGVLKLQPAAAPSGDQPAGLGGQVQGAFLSTDGGNTWLRTNLSGVTDIISIATSPNFPTDHLAYAASSTTGLYKSTDGGHTWNPLTVPGFSHIAIVKLSPAFLTDQTMFVAGIYGGILKSTDGGNTWTMLAQTGGIRALDLEISPNYAVDQCFYAGTYQKGLLRFFNGGANISILSGFTDNFVTAIALSPNFAKDHTVFAAGYHGLFTSTNSGNTWTYVVIPARTEDTRNINGALQEPPSITYQGMWSLVTPSTAASTNSYMSTSESGDVAVFNFTGSGFRWISQTGPLQGSAAIQVDGVPQGTVNLTAPLDAFQQDVWEQHGLTCGPHTFSITAQSLPGQSVTLDAIDVWIDTCPLMGSMR